MKTKVEELNELSFISFRETKDLDKSEIIYVDYSLNENNESSANVFSKIVSCGSIEVDDTNFNIRELVKTLFIQRVNMNIKSENIINIDSKLLDKVDNIIPLTLDKFINELKSENDIFKNNDKFVIVAENLRDKKVLNVLYGKDYSLNESSNLDNEIIFGYKTKMDQPGIVVISNEEGLKDNKNLRIAITDLGFFPDKCYYKIKIS